MNLRIWFQEKLRIFKDFFFNIFASVILTFSLQLVILPLISRQMDSSSFGQILTIIGIINLFGVSSGNTLNNTRLLTQRNYDKFGDAGDFNFIVILIILIVSGFVFIALNMSGLASLSQILLGIAITILLVCRSYYSVSFRLKLDFKGILISNVLVSFGYFLGLIVFYMTKNWYFIFLFGEILAIIYILRNNPLLKEGLVIGALFYSILKKFSFLLASTFIFTSIMYMDRFIIFPILGPDSVAIFSVSSFLGKTTGLVMGPISGVLLSYYVKEESINLNIFLKRLFLFLIFSLLIFVGILLFGRFLINILYPSIAPMTDNYFVLANLALIILMLGNTLSPILLRFCHLRWQPITQAVYVVLYIVLGYIAISNFGLLGFCYALVFVNTFRLLMLIVIVLFSLKKNNLDEVLV